MKVTSTNIQSLVNFRNSQGVDARGTLLRLNRSSVIFEVYNPYSIVQLSEIVQDLKIRRGSRVIYHGRGVVNNLVNTGLLIIVSVTLIDPWQDLAQLFRNNTGVRGEVGRFISDWEESHSLRTDYRLAVTEMRSFLGELSRWLEQADVVAATEGITDSPKLYEEFFQELAYSLQEPVRERFEQFESAADNVIKEHIVHYQQFSQRDVHPLTMTAPFLSRIFHKPLGYAGDYEMISMIYRNKPEGPNTYARLLHYLFLQRPVAVSVRNRSDQLLRMLNKETQERSEQTNTINLLSVGCGPAYEVCRLIKKNDKTNQCHFHLMDFNKETLDFARNQTREACFLSKNTPDFSFIHESIHQLLKDASRKDLRERATSMDIIYCAGLFDYLSDKVCSRVIKLMHGWLKPGGLLYVTNMHSDNRDRHTMEHLAEWHLIYRDENRMRKLVPDLNNQNMYKDSTGLNLILEIRKPKTDRAN